MNVFELVASLKLNTDEYDKGLQDAENDAQGASNGISGLFSKANITMAAAGAAAVVAAKKVVEAVTDITRQSVAAYGNYEQLTGGVETMFKTSSSKVMEYANDAYKAAGLSANAYMETVTGFPRA